MGSSYRDPPVIIFIITLLAFIPHEALAGQAFTTTKGLTPNIPASVQPGLPSIAVNSHAVTIHISLASGDTSPFYIGYSINQGPVVRYAGPGNQPFTAEQPLYISDLPDGAYSIAVTAYDQANNPSAATLTYAFVVDTELPKTEITKFPPPLSNQAFFVFGFNASKYTTEYGRVGFQCSINGGRNFLPCGVCKLNAQPCEGSYQIDLGADPDGEHTFAVYAEYKFTVVNPLVTLREPTPQKHTFTIDSTPPTFTVTETPKLRTNKTEAKFAWTCEDVHGCSARCKLDGHSLEKPAKKRWSSCESPLTLKVSSRTHAFQMYCTDAVGNDTPTALYTWFVRTKPPLTQFNTAKKVITVINSPKHPNYQQPPGMYGFTTVVKEVNGKTATVLEMTNAPNATIHFQCAYEQSYKSSLPPPLPMQSLPPPLPKQSLPPPMQSV